MSMMTREDQLNVLELLPVWQLKESRLNKPETTKKTEAAHEVFSPQSVVAAINVDAINVNKPLHVPTFGIRQFVSEDGGFTFLLENSPNVAAQQEAEILLSNIFKAMKVTCRAEAQFDGTQSLPKPTSKVVIAMGERVANYLLEQSYDVAQWRDLQTQQPLQYKTTPLVVTYCLNHLMANSTDKAKTWADLCVAKAILHTLL